MAVSNIVLNTTNRSYVSPSLRSIPSLEGADIIVTNNWFNYRDPGQDTIMLLGHADPDDGLFEPKQVLNAQETINFLGADTSSPLLRAFLEVLDAGCRNVFIYPVAPMSEYVSEANLTTRFDINTDWNGTSDTPESSSSFPSLISPTLDWNNNNFYERYFNRLHVAYSKLEAMGYMDGIGLMVPVEAVHHDSGDVDFTNQLIDFCYTYFSSHGSVTLGILGTRIPALDQTEIDAIVSDTRLNPATNSNLEYGKFVMVVMGEGIIVHKSTSLTHNSSLAVQTAANLAVYDLNRSVAGTRFIGCANVVGPTLTDAQCQSLALARVNPVVRTTRGKRGFSFETKLLTDNTLSGFVGVETTLGSGMTNTDFWSMTQMHIVSSLINEIKGIGEQLIGERLSDITNFERTVGNKLNTLVANNIINDYSLNIEKVPEQYKVLVTLGIVPVFGIRNIYFQILTGPS